MSDVGDDDSPGQVETEETQPIEKFIPRHPFDDPSADFILRSNDDVDFKVHKTILAMASPVFRDMLMLAQDPADVPVLRLTEDHTVLDWILRACYPTSTPDLKDLDFIYNVVQIADKYQMDFVVDNLTTPLNKYLESEPLRVFAIAYRFRNPTLATSAARQTLRIPANDIIQADIPEFRSLPVFALQRLLQYRKRCTDAAVALTSHLTWVDDLTPCWWKNHPVHDAKTARCETCTVITKTVLNQHIYETYHPRQWFVDRMTEVGQLLSKCPVGSVIAWKRIPKSALECSICGPAAANDLVAFSKVLAAKVDEVVAKVCMYQSFPNGQPE